MSWDEQDHLLREWNWQVQVPELGTSVSILPSDEQFQTKIGQEHSQLRVEPRENPCRAATGVHDLRHTVGHRLHAAGVSYEDRQDLLGHKSGRTTTQYSAPDISRLIEVAETLCRRRANTVLRVAHTNLKQSASPAKTVQEGRV